MTSRRPSRPSRRSGSGRAVRQPGRGRNDPQRGHDRRVVPASEHSRPCLDPAPRGRLRLFGTGNRRHAARHRGRQGARGSRSRPGCSDSGGDHRPRPDRRALIALARPLRVTFHKAFDQTREPLEALDTLIALGVERVLTSGGRPTALEGIETLAQLVDRAGDRSPSWPAAGSTSTTSRPSFDEAGVSEVHLGSAASRTIEGATPPTLDGPTLEPDRRDGGRDDRRVDDPITASRRSRSSFSSSSDCVRLTDPSYQRYQINRSAVVYSAGKRTDRAPAGRSIP